MSISDYEAKRLMFDLNASLDWNDTYLANNVVSCLRRALATSVENVHQSELILAYHLEFTKYHDKNLKSCLLFFLRSTADYKPSAIYSMIETIRNIMLQEGMLDQPSLMFLLGGHEVQKTYISRAFTDQKIITENDEFKQIIRDSNPKERLISVLKPLYSKSTVCPFYHLGPCSTDMFVGRNDLIKEIVFGKNTAYVVSGGRRIGKSSLLFKIMHDTSQGVFADTQYHPLYIDCSNFNTFKTLTDHIARKLSPKIYHTKEFKEHKYHFDYIFSRTQLNNKTLFLFLDEMDSLIKNAGASSMDSNRFFNLIRSEVNKKKIRFVISGFRHISNMINDSNHQLYNLSMGIHLDPLTKSETNKLVTIPLLKNDIVLEDEEEVTRRIYGLTGGHPSVVQFIMRYLFTHRINDIITANDLNKVFRTKELINYILENFVMNTNSFERLLCLLCLDLDDITLESAMKIFKNNKIAVNNLDGKIICALRNMKNNNLFRQHENRYQFLFQLMQKILKNYYDSHIVRWNLIKEVQNEQE